MSCPQELIDNGALQWLAAVTLAAVSFTLGALWARRQVPGLQQSVRDAVDQSRLNETRNRDASRRTS